MDRDTEILEEGFLISENQIFPALCTEISYPNTLPLSTSKTVAPGLTHVSQKNGH